MTDAKSRRDTKNVQQTIASNQEIKCVEVVNKFHNILNILQIALYIFLGSNNVVGIEREIY